MPVQETSVISYYNILNELSERQKEVLICLKKIKIANNTLILKEMNKKYPRMQISSITGRMKEIREKQTEKPYKNSPIIRLHHVGACPETGNTTKFYCLVSYFDKFIQC